MLVNESINKIEESAGLVILQDNKILMVHPTGSSWYHSYSIPKGNLKPNESKIDAAIRETYEETHILIDKSEIENEMHTIEYRTKSNILYKNVYYFIVNLNRKIKIEKSKLQKDEVDWCGFLDKKELEKRVSKRFLSLLDLIS